MISVAAARLGPVRARLLSVCQQFGSPGELSYLYPARFNWLAHTRWLKLRFVFITNNLIADGVCIHFLRSARAYPIIQPSVVEYIVFVLTYRRLHSMSKVPARVDGRFRLGKILGSGSYGTL